MAYSPIEDKYLSALTAVQFPDEPVGLEMPQTDAMPEPVQVAQAGSITAYDPTTREKLSEFLQAGFERFGMDRYKARQRAQTFLGGPSSNLPLDLGFADVVPFLGTALQTEEAVRMGGDAVTSAQQGNYGTAALQAGGAALGMVPGVVGTVKAGKALAKETGQQLNRAIMEGTGPLAAVVPQSARPLNIVQPGPNLGSTRLPTAVKRTEDPLTSRLVIDLQATKQDPEAFAHNMGLIRQYPNFASKARNPDKQAEDFITEVKNNLLFLHDQVPDATRQRSKLWYDGARNITDRFSADYGVPDQAVSGVLAVLSPQKDWFMNVSLGQRVLDIATRQQSTRWDSSMDAIAQTIFGDPKYAPMVDAIRGKTLAEVKEPGLKAMWLRTTTKQRTHASIKSSAQRATLLACA